MKSLKNRILPGLLAIVLALSLFVPALADDDPPPPPNQTTITGNYVAPVIAVTVPSTGEVVISPYAIPIELDDTAKTKLEDQQIMTKPLFIINNSDLDLRVSATVIGTPTGILKLATAAPAAGDITNSAFVYMQMSTTTLKDADKVSGGTTLDKDKSYPVFAAWDPAYSADNDLVVSNKAGTPKEMAKLAKSTITESGGSKTITWNEGSIAMFRLSGQVTEEPKTAWTAADGFSVTVAFTFKPDSVKASLAVDKSEIDLSGDNDTATLTASIKNAEVEKIEWSISPAVGSNVTFTGTENSPTATLKVATGASSTAETHTITAKITTKTGEVYTATATVKVTGDNP